jgi:AbrB family looped-hinge helix DNA binding protein
MRTTIDAAGRVVIPKPLRDAAGLLPGAAVELALVDGRLEIEIIAADVQVVVGADGLPLIVGGEELPPLSREEVRGTLEATRR